MEAKVDTRTTVNQKKREVLEAPLDTFELNPTLEELEGPRYAR